MKKVKTLKELIVMPFVRGTRDCHFRIYSGDSTSPFVTVNYANFNSAMKAPILFNDFCNFVLQALNEKRERDYGI